ncbi:MAG: glutamate-cysteine ligase family protein, partial [Beijerinckiaceae bacterium]
RYVDYALDVPMYFIKRGDLYIDATGTSFRDLLAGRHPLLPGETAVLSDWANHMSTIFPDVRLKRYLEMRGADAGPTASLTALSAFWVGLLYDRNALDATFDMVKGWTAAEREALRDAVPREGLTARIAGRDLKQIARQALDLSRAGLAARGRLDAAGRDETHHLDALEPIVETGTTLAHHWLAKFHGEWGGSVLPAFRECVF